jgi:uncharacterized membrane protein YfcA
MSAADWALIVVAFLLAGAVKGVVGLGLPTVAVGLLSLVMSPAQAAALLVLPSMITNVWQLAVGPAFISIARRLWLLLVALFVGALVGGWYIPIDNSGRAVTALGVVLATYAAVGLLLPRFSVPRRMEPLLSPFVGILTGLVTASTGVFVVPMVPYIQALGFERDDLVQALGLAFTVATVALAVSLIHNQQFELTLAGPSVVALLVSLIGMYAGQEIRKRVDPQTFRRWFFLGMLILGLHLASRALW